VVSSPGGRIALKQFGAFVLDTANQCLWNEGAQVALQPKPFAVLRYLVENPGRLITHDELLDKLWPETFVQPQVLRTYMLELRKILGDDAGQPRFIQTLPKRGYCFVAAVSEGGAVRRGGPQAAPAVEVPRLVGRDKELARLCAELAHVMAGERRVIFLSGEAGIGKTSLTDAFSREAASVAAGEGIAVARGQCVPGFEKEQFYPVLEALSRLCASPDGEAACRALSRLAPEWLVPLGRHDSAAGRELMPGNLCAALEEVAAAKPLLLVLEDVQWADGATLNLISALARRRAPARLMVLATMRSRSVAAELKQLRQDLLLQHACVELVLTPLGKSAMTELMGRELKQEAVPPRLAPFIQQHAEGNPLFAIAILNHLMAQAVLVQHEGGEWGLAADFDERSAGVPDELAQMVELEIDRLPADEQRLLEAGSLMRVVFPAWAVAAALEQDVDVAEDACVRLARKLHFVVRAGQDELPDGSSSAFYAFSHGIYREMLWLRQSAAQRAHQHIRIAERLGQLFAGREAHVAHEMAMHYEAAGSWQRGAGALRAAARYATERRAHAEAVELLERALGIAEQHTEAQAEVSTLRDELIALQSAGAAAAKREKRRPESLTLS
jgi:predicted ATPase/DNA-binding winged helix-turn-helix (wHTH) protein